jgi:hypothetical protein
VFWHLQSSFEIARVPEDSKFPLLGVRVSSSHLPQNGVATLFLPFKNHYLILHRCPIVMVIHWGISNYPLVLNGWLIFILTIMLFDISWCTHVGGTFKIFLNTISFFIFLNLGVLLHPTTCCVLLLYSCNNSSLKIGETYCGAHL